MTTFNKFTLRGTNTPATFTQTENTVRTIVAVFNGGIDAETVYLSGLFTHKYSQSSVSGDNWSIVRRGGWPSDFLLGVDDSQLAGGISADGDVSADSTGAVFDSTVADKAATLTSALSSLDGKGGRFIAPRTNRYASLSSRITATGASFSKTSLLGGWYRHAANGITDAIEGIFSFIHGPSSSDHVTDITIDDAKVQGNGTSDQSKAIQFGFSDRITFRGVQFSDVGREGLYCVGSTTVKISGCHGTNIGKGGSNLSAYNPNCDSLIATGNTCYDVGMFMEQTGRGAVVHGNFFEKAAIRGLMLHSTTAANELLCVTGNVLVDAPNACMIADQSNSIGKGLFVGNLIYQSGPTFNFGSKTTSGQPYVSMANYSLHGKTASEYCYLGSGGHISNGDVVAKITGTTTGSISSGSSTLTVPFSTTQGHSIVVGTTLTIAGVSGTKTVTAVSADKTSITIDVAAGATVTNAAVTFTSAQWAYMFNVGVDDYHVIRNFTCVGLTWTTFFAYLRGAGKTEFHNVIIQPRGESFSGAYILVMRDALGTAPITHGQYLLGSDFDCTVPWSYGPRSCDIVADALPPALTWYRGARVRKRNPAAGASPGWVCIQEGTAGTLNGGATVATIANAGDRQATLSTTLGIYPGSIIAINTMGGYRTVETIAGSVVTWPSTEATAGVTGSGLATSYSAPVWKAEAAVAS